MPHEQFYGNRVWVCNYNITELADTYNMEPHKKNKKHEDECEPTKGNTEWRGGIKTRTDAVDILTKGWDKGAAKAINLGEGLSCSLTGSQTKRRKHIWSGDGHDLDIDRALAGNWDYAWRTTHKIIGAGQTLVTLVAGWGGNCHLSADQLFWSGAAMLVISDVLENAGFSTRIDMVSKLTANGSEDRGKLALNIITVKDHGEPLRIDGLAGVACHAGIFRTFGFRAFLRIPFHLDYGLGHCEEWPNTDQIIKDTKCGFEWPSHCVRVNDCYSKNDALQEIKRVLSLTMGDGVSF